MELKTRLQIPDEAVYGPNALVFLQATPPVVDPAIHQHAVAQDLAQVQLFSMKISLPGLVAWLVSHYTYRGERTVF